MVNLGRYQGCLLGLALGDALGAPFEGGPMERLLWRLIGRTRQGEMRWTDDTQMSLDLAESLAAKGAVDADDLAGRFAAGYHWSRGYGPGAAKLLKRIARGSDWRQVNRSVYAGGSFGNGGAMRAPIVGVYFAGHGESLVDAARLTASITHAHPLGMEGAVLVAAATALAAQGSSPIEILDGAASHCKLEPFVIRLDAAAAWLRNVNIPEPRVVQRGLGCGIAAAESCVTAVYIAVRFLDRSFDEMQAFVVRCGGDVDTIGAMAGGIWGARNGIAKLPEQELARLEQRERLLDVSTALHETRLRALN